MAHQKFQLNYSSYGASTADMPFRRRMLLATLGALSAGVSACRPSEGEHNIFKVSPMNETNKQADFAYFDVTLISYIDRPIFDVYLNKQDIGAALAFGGGGLRTGVKVPLGQQSISWRLDGPEGMKGNGDIVHPTNTPILPPSPMDYRYLAVHIYPDSTVDLIPEKFWPRTRTERGESLFQQWKSKN